MAIIGLRGLALDNATYLQFITGNLWWNQGTSACGFRDGAVNVFPCSLVRPSRRISQMHQEVVGCFRGGKAEMSRLMACFEPAIATRVAQVVSVFNRVTFTTCIHCGGSRPFSRCWSRSAFSAQTQCCFAMTIGSLAGDENMGFRG